MYFLNLSIDIQDKDSEYTYLRVLYVFASGESITFLVDFDLFVALSFTKGVSEIYQMA